MLKRHLGVFLLCSAVAAGCAVAAASEGKPQGAAMAIRSPAFEHNQSMPSVYTCEGKNISPPLSWSGVPQNAKSLVLIVDDPDAPDPAAPNRTWTHWIVYDIPPNVVGLKEAAKAVPAGAREGLNDSGQVGYGGPCPPIGRHRYFHKLYALDVTLPELRRPVKGQLEAAIKGHVIGQAELIGTYQKKK